MFVFRHRRGCVTSRRIFERLSCQTTHHGLHALEVGASTHDHSAKAVRTIRDIEAMRNFIILLLILGALALLRNWGHWNASEVSGQSPISNPVYAVIRFRTDIHDRTIDAVAYARTNDETECQHGSDKMVERVLNPERSNGPAWTLQSSECKTELDAHSAKLFDNKPINVAYLSAAPGGGTEREFRLIFWGVTVQEGDLICDQAKRVQDQWTGTVTCIRAIPSSG
jgi:hypothetical protein